MKCKKCETEVKSLVNDTWCKFCFNNIDKSEWRTKKTKLFEYDSKNKIVDVFVRQDPLCPFPFHKEDWWHQGFYLDEFIIMLDVFLQKHDIPYEIIENEKI